MWLQVVNIPTILLVQLHVEAEQHTSSTIDTQKSSFVALDVICVAIVRGAELAVSRKQSFKPLHATMEHVMVYLYKQRESAGHPATYPCNRRQQQVNKVTFCQSTSLAVVE
jgi:D-aminopeptidase